MRIAIAIINNRDGSATVSFFKNEKLAEASLKNDDERMCDDVYTIDLPLDESKVEFYAETEDDEYPRYHKGEMKL